MLELMKLSDLLMRIGDTKKLVCHRLPDILFAESHVALANLVLDVVLVSAQYTMGYIACFAWQFRHSTLHVYVHLPVGSSCCCCRNQLIQTGQLVPRDSFGRMSPSAQLWGLLSGLTTQLLGTQAWLHRVLRNQFLMRLNVTSFSRCAQSFQSFALTNIKPRMLN